MLAKEIFFSHLCLISHALFRWCALHFAVARKSCYWSKINENMKMSSHDQVQHRFNGLCKMADTAKKSTKSILSMSAILERSWERGCWVKSNLAPRLLSLHWTALHCTALHCTALHCTALRCNALHLIHYSINLCIAPSLLGHNASQRSSMSLLFSVE